MPDVRVTVTATLEDERWGFSLLLASLPEGATDSDKRDAIRALVKEVVDEVLEAGTWQISLEGASCLTRTTPGKELEDIAQGLEELVSELKQDGGSEDKLPGIQRQLEVLTDKLDQVGGSDEEEPNALRSRKAPIARIVLRALRLLEERQREAELKLFEDLEERIRDLLDFLK